MKKAIRIPAIIIALLMIVSVFVSCGETAKTPATTTASAEKQEETEGVTFPEADYGGETFTVYAREASTYNNKAIYASEQNGDVLNDQTLKRNQAVEAKYNVKIEMKTATNPVTQLSALLQSDTIDFDIILDQRNKMGSAITSGYLKDWNSVGIDMTTSWWDINCAENYDVNGKAYMAVNDVSIANLANCYFFYFNKAIVENYSLTSPYDYVSQNNWTLDNFIALVKAVSSPSSDPTTLGTYGMVKWTGSANGSHMHLFTACGISYVKWVDGQLTSNIDESTITKLQDITDRISQIFTSEYSLTTSEIEEIDKSTGYTNVYNKARGNFATGHFLFVTGGMGVSDQFQDMDKGFGVVPNPKYTADQENYYHKVDSYALLWVLPNYAGLDTERLASVVDYWAYESQSTVMSAYYDTVIKSRNVDEATAGHNLDIIKGSIYYELGDIFTTGISGALNDGFKAGNISSQFSTAGQKMIAANLKKVNTALASLNG